MRDKIISNLIKTAEIKYRGQTFPGYNKPVRNDAGGTHKMKVLAKKGDKVKVVRFGHRSYGHNYSPKAKSNYLKRSAGIRNKSGELTKNDKFSANHWARKVLWPQNRKADGGTSLDRKKTAAVAVKRDPSKWEAAKREAKAKMGGKHSARAMQLATQIYKKKGGTYAGNKPSASTNKLKKWTKQKWQWSGKDKPGQGGSGVYLPKKSVSALKNTRAGRQKLVNATREKLKATRSGQQFSSHGLHEGKNRSKLK
tara:strand:- start:30 stop:788 length:759 start_codon:yes stop_codon:yes gene_type:complete